MIVEAKGSSDHTRTTWHHGRPSILRTAKQQVKTTAVFPKGSQRRLPARRWVVASRWATEKDGLQPTLLVWDPEERNLESDVWRTLLHVLFTAELEVLREGFQLAGPRGVAELQPLQVRVGNYVLPRGAVAVAGPFGIRPIRRRADLSEWWPVARAHGNVAVMALSVEYEEAVRLLPSDPERSLALLDKMRTDSFGNNQDHDGLEGPSIGVRAVSRSGLTVVWPRSDERIEFVDAWGFQLGIVRSQPRPGQPATGRKTRRAPSAPGARPPAEDAGQVLPAGASTAQEPETCAMASYQSSAAG